MVDDRAADDEPTGDDGSAGAVPDAGGRFRRDRTSRCIFSTRSRKSRDFRSMSARTLAASSFGSSARAGCACDTGRTQAAVINTRKTQARSGVTAVVPTRGGVLVKPYAIAADPASDRD